MCTCASAVRGEVAGWPARCLGEQVVRSGWIWPWWLDIGLAGACCAELERLIRRKRVSGVSRAGDGEAFECRFLSMGIAEVFSAAIYAASEETLDSCDRTMTVLWHHIPLQGFIFRAMH